jgi:uncharacterized protein (TIGR03435 family)
MSLTVSRREATRLCFGAITSAALLLPRTAQAQSATPQTQSAVPPPPSAAPEFDVSTVKPTAPSEDRTDGIATRSGLVDGRNVTLQRCIIGAYSVGPHQVVGGPDWVYTDRWDIMGKSDQPIGDDAILNQMLQRLLADRFKLTMHRESKVLPAYVLEVDKKGPKMVQAEGGDSDTNTSTSNTGRVRINAKNTDMNLFAEVLARKMDLPVVNQTGLAGIFNFKLQWTLDSAPPSDRQTADNVSIYTALEEQLGLRLRAAKAPVEVLVIDHAEKPGEN